MMTWLSPHNDYAWRRDGVFLFCVPEDDTWLAMRPGVEGMHNLVSDGETLLASAMQEVDDLWPLEAG